MPFREIPRRKWSSFLDDFSRMHDGCTCTLDVDSQVAGSEPEASHASFRGIVCEPGPNGPTIQVFVGDPPQRHVAHTVAQPTAVWLEETDDGSDRGVAVGDAAHHCDHRRRIGWNCRVNEIGGARLSPGVDRNEKETWGTGVEPG